MAAAKRARCSICWIRQRPQWAAECSGTGSIVPCSAWTRSIAGSRQFPSFSMIWRFGRICSSGWAGSMISSVFAVALSTVRSMRAIALHSAIPCSGSLRFAPCCQIWVIIRRHWASLPRSWTKWRMLLRFCNPPFAMSRLRASRMVVSFGTGTIRRLMSSGRSSTGANSGWLSLSGMNEKRPESAT